MDTCQQIREMMSLYIDNELSGEQQAFFNEHIKECAECEAELSQLAEIVQTLRRIPDEELPEGFHEAFMEKLAHELPVRKKASSRTFFRAFRPYAAAAAGITVTLLVMSSMFTMLTPKLSNSAEQNASNMAPAVVGIAGMSNYGASANGTGRSYVPEREGIALDSQAADSVMADGAGVTASMKSFSGSGAMSADAAPVPAATAAPAEIRMTIQLENSFDQTAAPAAEAAQPELKSEEYFIKSFNITLEVDDLRYAAGVIDSLNGYNISSSLNYSAPAAGYGQSRIERRVSEGEYQYAKELLRSLGSVRTEYESEKRVTDDILDTRARLTAKETEAARLYSLLENSVSIDVMTMLERRLSRVEEEKDSLNSRLLNTDAMPTLNITLLVKAEDVVEFNSGGGFGRRVGMALTRSVNATVRMFEGFLVFISGAAVPVLLLTLVCGMVFFVRKFIRGRGGNEKK